MRLFLRNKLYQHRLYWLLREWYSQISHEWRNILYKFRVRRKNSYTDIKTVRSFINRSSSPFVFAFLTTVVLYILDEFTSVPTSEWGFKIQSDTSYVSFLGTIAGIGGVFIGLYYAGMSSIASAIYSSVPSDIRELFRNDRDGRVYIRILSYMTVTSVLLIGAHLIGLDRPQLAVVFMMFLAGVGIVSFVGMGYRLFDLLDPTVLSKNIFEDIFRYLSHLQIGGYRWDQQAFQQYWRRKAVIKLESLETLIDIGGSSKHLSKQPLINLCVDSVRSLARYFGEKRFIPHSSLWYGEKYKHKNFYATDETSVLTATVTSTSILPEKVKDSEWFEDRMERGIADIVDIFIRNDSFDRLLLIFPTIDSYTSRIARAGDLTRANTLIYTIGDKIIDCTSGINTTNGSESLDFLWAIESIPTMLINNALEYYQYFDEITLLNFTQSVEKIDWTKLESIYKSDLKDHHLDTAEWIKERILFEYSTDGKQITPTWYISELLLFDEVKFLSREISVLIDRVAAVFERWESTTLNNKAMWATAALRGREMEYWNKVLYQLPNIEKFYSQTIDHVRIKGLEWPEINFSQHKGIISSRNRLLMKAIASESMVLSAIRVNDEYPDYGGQFLSMTGEGVLDALINNLPDVLEQIFSDFLIGSMHKFDENKPKRKPEDWRYAGELKIATAPLLDLLYLSGYSILLSEYHDNSSLVDIVFKAWDDFLSERGKPEQLMGLIGHLVSVTEADISLGYRWMLRDQWRQKIDNLFAQIPREGEYYPYGMHPTEEKIEHPSHLIRLYVKSRHLIHLNPIDIFVQRFVRSRAAYKGISFGNRSDRNIQELEDDIEEESNKDSQT